MNVINFPVPTRLAERQRDPITEPWQGDLWGDCEQYARRFEGYREQCGAHWVFPVKDRTHVQYTVLRGGRVGTSNRWSTAKWLEWVQRPTTKLLQPGTDPEAPNRDERLYGALRVKRLPSGGRKIAFEWGEIEIIPLQPGVRKFVHNITVHGVGYEVSGMDDQRLDMGWGFFQGVEAALSLDVADRAAWLAAFEANAGNITEFRK